MDCRILARTVLDYHHRPNHRHAFVRIKTFGSYPTNILRNEPTARKPHGHCGIIPIQSSTVKRDSSVGLYNRDRIFRQSPTPRLVALRQGQAQASNSPQQCSEGFSPIPNPSTTTTPPNLPLFDQSLWHDKPRNSYNVDSRNHCPCHPISTVVHSRSL